MRPARVADRQDRQPDLPHRSHAARGITLRYGGIQLDDSIRSRLERLRRSLSQTVV